jgi:hypothetical protein
LSNKAADLQREGGGSIGFLAVFVGIDVLIFAFGGQG